MVATAVGRYVGQIEECLQNATDQLMQWAKKDGMELNALKTKVMLFSDTVNKVSVKINDKVLDCVTSFKYLGVFLDKQMDFSLLVNYAALKAKRAMAKVGTLINGRKGSPIRIGIDLYKALVRPHLEYMVPVWASITDKQVDKLQSVQVQCLKTVVGAKAHSSSSAVEVITDILPFCFRRRELCCREYVRIITQDNSQELKQLLTLHSSCWTSFCPLEYIRVVSRQLDRAISGCQLIKPECIIPENYMDTKLTILPSSTLQNFAVSEVYQDIMSVAALIKVKQLA